MKLSEAITICQTEGIVHPVAMEARIEELMKKSIIKYKYTHSQAGRCSSTIYRYFGKRCQFWDRQLEKWKPACLAKLPFEKYLTKEKAIALFPKAFPK